MKKSVKDKLILAGAIVLAVVVAVWLFGSGTGPIEDTNGPDDYSLNTITDANIINRDIGAMNVSKESGLLNDGITFSSKNFSGVYEIFLTNFLGKSDFLMDVTGFDVTKGNFKMAVVNNDQIIAVVEPGMFAECYLEDLTGSLSLRIAGESAEFTFSLSKLFCDQYGIEIDK